MGRASHLGCGARASPFARKWPRQGACCALAKSTDILLLVSTVVPVACCAICKRIGEGGVGENATIERWWHIDPNFNCGSPGLVVFPASRGRAFVARSGFGLAVPHGWQV